MQKSNSLYLQCKSVAGKELCKVFTAKPKTTGKLPRFGLCYKLNTKTVLLERSVKHSGEPEPDEGNRQAGASVEERGASI